jgi:hypothetical protein
MPIFFAAENSADMEHNYFDFPDSSLLSMSNASVLSVSSVAKLSTILNDKKKNEC